MYVHAVRFVRKEEGGRGGERGRIGQGKGSVQPMIIVCMVVQGEEVYIHTWRKGV
jgi:hypothetical protein